MLMMMFRYGRYSLSSAIKILFAKSNLGLNFVPNPTQIPKFTTGLITSNNDNIVVWPDSTPMTGGNA